MSSGYSDNYIDRIRYLRGSDTCKAAFQKLCVECRQKAICVINDRRLRFASLFVLQPEINEFGLQEELSERNKIALRLCEKITAGKEHSENSEDKISLKSEDVHRVLLWMLNTGVIDDGLDDEFDQIIDIAASLLIKTHHEESVLPTIANLIFGRNRAGRYNHDLIWAFFQTRNIKALRYIADYLRSPDAKDVGLARKLLNLSPGTEWETISGRQEQYGKYLSWLRENESYLYFTGESLQFSNSPALFNANVEAKYLCKNNDSRNHKPIVPYTEEELSRLSNFNNAPEDEKSVLADYSQSLYKNNHRYWNQWVHYPIDKQIDIANNGRRELV
jgi:hypothetical protein